MENNHFDELLYSLPDYITGELNDDNIKEQIEAKLLTDFSFREEYDSLKRTMNFLQEAELESPSEVYFANLQADILSKVNSKYDKKEVGFLGRLAGYWKVVIPALTVCVVIIIYTNNMNTPPIPLTQENSKIPVMTKQDTNEQNTIVQDKLISSEDTMQNENSVPDQTFVSTKRHLKVNPEYSNTNSSSDENVNITDEAEGNVFFSREDDAQTQDEYENLSTDDQLDIIQSLKDKKL